MLTFFILFVLDAWKMEKPMDIHLFKSTLRPDFLSKTKPYTVSLNIRQCHCNNLTKNKKKNRIKWGILFEVGYLMDCYIKMRERERYFKDMRDFLSAVSKIISLNHFKWIRCFSFNRRWFIKRFPIWDFHEWDNEKKTKQYFLQLLINWKKHKRPLIEIYVTKLNSIWSCNKLYKWHYKCNYICKKNCNLIMYK